MKDKETVLEACARIEKLAWDADGKGTPAVEVLNKSIQILNEARRKVREPKARP